MATCSKQNEGNLETAFKAFAAFGDPKSAGESITLSNCEKWLKQANVVEGTIAIVDVGIAFKKSMKRTLDYQTFLKFLDVLAKTKNADLGEIKRKLESTQKPELYKATRPSEKTLAVDGRLTDTSRYTGTHKERFDDAGKGKGIEGRFPAADDDGYVTGYTNKGTYDKKK